MPAPLTGGATKPIWLGERARVDNFSMPNPSANHVAPPMAWPVLCGAALLAVVVPTLLVINVPPSTTFFNQAAALLGWAVFLGALSWRNAGPVLEGSTGLKSLLSVFALYAAAALLSMAWTGFPSTLAFSAVGLMLAATVTLVVSAGLARAGHAERAFHALAIALVVAGVLGVAIGVVQVFFPALADGTWIAPSSLEGRSTGNLRQPNHLSSLLLWSTIASVWLAESGRMSWKWGAALVVLFMFGLVMASSRTGVAGIVLLAIWGLLDRRLSRQARATLVLAPVVYLAFFLAALAWAHATGQHFGGEARLSEGTSSPNSRLNIWSNTLSLIAGAPWTGVGFGEFNRAWTLTPFPNRPTAFFDHTHNLPLQFAVELGVPLALVLLGLLGWALWKAFRVGQQAASAQAAMLRAAFMMVLMIALHSMFEYPLWYVYFLLPAAFMFGICLGHEVVDAQAPAPSLPQHPGTVRPLLMACVLMFGGGAVSVIDYLRVAQIFMADESRPLAHRIAAGQRSLFFAHHAAYAAVTTNNNPSKVMPSFDLATHFLLDTRLLLAWSVALYEKGDVERARYVAQRLKEFRNEDTDTFFARCFDPAETPESRPYQCIEPSGKLGYRDFTK